MIHTFGGYTIRAIKEEDNAAIAQVIRSVLLEHNAAKPGTVYYDKTTDDLYNLFAVENAVYFVVELNGALVGGCGIYPTEGLPDKCCELVKLYLLPTARRKGIGKHLLELCCATAAKHNYTNIYLESMPELSAAISLYESCGFRVLNKQLGNTGHYGCDLWMLKEL